MKYKTFRNVLIAGGVAAVSVGVYEVRKHRKEAPRPPETLPTPRPVAAPAPAPAPPPDPTPTPNPTPAAAGQPLRPIDARILARLKQPISGADKVKDAFKSEAIKVNLYQEAGQKLPNRVKLDLDRDDRWDEKWTVDGANITREVSTADDDKTYDVRWLLGDGVWTPERGAAEVPAPAPPPAPPADGVALRPMDQEILDLARRGIPGDKVKDATAGKPYKVSLYHDAGATGVNRLKLDLDRDEKWDEKWTFDGDEVKRQVAPGDDESYSEEYRLRGGAWVKK